MSLLLQQVPNIVKVPKILRLYKIKKMKITIKIESAAVGHKGDVSTYLRMAVILLSCTRVCVDGLALSKPSFFGAAVCSQFANSLCKYLCFLLKLVVYIHSVLGRTPPPPFRSIYVADCVDLPNPLRGILEGARRLSLFY